MSPWRPEIACVGWEGARIALLYRRGRAIVAAHSVAVAPDAALDERLAHLAALADGRRPAARAEIVVSDRYARYCMFERPAGLRDLGELDAVVAAAFEARFGQDAADWRIEFDLAPGATTGFACALPRRLVEGFAALVPRLARGAWSVRPHCVATLMTHAASLPRDAWFAAGADGQVALARAAAGAWQQVRVIAADGAGALVAELARERLRLSEAEDAAPLYAVGECGAVPPGARRLGVDAWPHAGAEFGLALAGARA